MWKVIRSFFEGVPTQSREAEQNATRATAIPIVALVLGDQDRELLKNMAGRNQLDVRITDSCGEAEAIANQKVGTMSWLSRSGETMLSGQLSSRGRTGIAR
jgi:hypothetical protein